jgi:hypothetical protein
MAQPRTSDLAIVLGHALQCEACRRRLLEEPDRVLVGRKITATQRADLAQLSEEDFTNSATLAAAVRLPMAELAEGIDHPRARLRHL